MQQNPLMAMNRQYALFEIANLKEAATLMMKGQRERDTPDLLRTILADPGCVLLPYGGGPIVYSTCRRGAVLEPPL